MMGMTEATGTTGSTLGEAPDDDEALLEDDLPPPPPAPLRSEVTDAVEDAIADARIAPKPVVPDTAARRLSSHSAI